MKNLKLQIISFRPKEIQPIRKIYLTMATLFYVTALLTISSVAQTKITEQTKSSAQSLIEGTDVTVKIVAVKDNVVSDKDYTKPDAGNKFVSVQIVIDNTKSENEWQVEPDKFKLKDAEGNIYNTESSMLSASGITQPTLKSGSVDGGDLVKGWITFQVGSAVNVKSLKIRYEDSGFMSETAVKSGWIGLSSVGK